MTSAIPDEEVDDFLDSMLDEFDHEQEEARVELANAPAPSSTVPITTPNAPPSNAASQGLSGVGNEEELIQFMKQFSDSDFGKALQQQIENDPEAASAMEKDVGKLLQEVMSTLPPTGDYRDRAEEAPSTVEESLDTAMRMVSEGSQGVLPQTENALGSRPEDALLQKLLGDFKDMDMGDSANMDVMIEQMMKQVMSKEALLPPLQQIVAKYPDWLEERKGSLTSDEINAYSSQLVIFKKICDVLEADTSENGEGSSAEVLQLMTSMQEFGQPPQDLMKDLVPGLEFDSHGQPLLPGMNGDAENCNIM